MTTTTTSAASTAFRGVPSPSEMHRAFIEACNAGDAGRLVQLYEPSAVIVERTGELSQGTDAIREHIARLLVMRPTMRILGSLAVVSDDLAQLSSWWQCSATAPDGSAMEIEGHGSELTRRQPDGSWLIVVDNPWGADAGGSIPPAKEGAA